jgi:hypothetical protein
MNKIRKKLVILAMVLIFSTLACTSIYVFAYDEDLCEAMGGRWNRMDQDCMEPFSGNTSIEESNSEPADENTSEPADETVSDPASEISIEDCVAQPDEYALEFANVSNEHSNETKEVCRGDFYLRNISNRVLHYKLYKYYDNGAMQNIGWLHSCSRLAPEEAFSTYFETQTWTNGDYTVHTFTKLIVFYDLPDCVNFLVDKENETLWEEFAIPLSDPCR